MKLVFLRHCESLFNSNPNFSQPDCGLSLKGHKQAKSIQIPEDISTIICSPMRRCKETLNGFMATDAEKLIPIIYTELCREHMTDPCDFYEFEKPVMESEMEVLERINQFKIFLSHHHPNKKILVISHADFIWYFTSNVVDGERFGTWLKNGEQMEVDFEMVNGKKSTNDG